MTVSWSFLRAGAHSEGCSCAAKDTAFERPGAAGFRARAHSRAARPDAKLPANAQGESDS